MISSEGSCVVLALHFKYALDFGKQAAQVLMEKANLRQHNYAQSWVKLYQTLAGLTTLLTWRIMECNLENSNIRQ
jgi:hypothetical protein